MTMMMMMLKREKKKDTKGKQEDRERAIAGATLWRDRGVYRSASTFFFCLAFDVAGARKNIRLRLSLSLSLAVYKTLRRYVQKCVDIDREYTRRQERLSAFHARRQATVSTETGVELSAS